MHESIYDEFVKKAVKAAERRVVGDPFKSGTQQGPQVQCSTSTAATHTAAALQIITHQCPSQARFRNSALAAQCPACFQGRMDSSCMCYCWASLEALRFVVIPFETVHAVRSLMLLPPHAQVSQEQFDKIMFLINKGVEEGAKLEFGGKRYGARSSVVCTLRSLLLFSMMSVVMRLLLK